MTTDQALARIMELVKMPPAEPELRKEIRRILESVHQRGYNAGDDEARNEGSWW
jgi:hypothetical protein